MRNAALVLGIIGGLWAMIIGFFGYGYTSFIEHHGAIGEFAEQVEHIGLVRAASFLSPILAIGGAAMARSRSTSRRSSIANMRPTTSPARCCRTCVAFS